MVTPPSKRGATCKQSSPRNNMIDSTSRLTHGVFCYTLASEDQKLWSSMGSLFNHKALSSADLLLSLSRSPPVPQTRPSDELKKVPLPSNCSFDVSSDDSYVAMMIAALCSVFRLLVNVSACAPFPFRPCSLYSWALNHPNHQAAHWHCLSRTVSTLQR